MGRCLTAVTVPTFRHVSAISGDSTFRGWRLAQPRFKRQQRWPIKINLRCCTLQLESFVRQLGHHVDTVGFKVIGFYGSFGFDASISVTRAELDVHFDAPITEIIEAAFGVINTELGAALPKLLAGILAAHQAYDEPDDYD
jgi:hypothetical protein